MNCGDGQHRLAHRLRALGVVSLSELSMVDAVVLRQAGLGLVNRQVLRCAPYVRGTEECSGVLRSRQGYTVVRTQAEPS